MTPDDFGGRTSGGGPMTPESLVRDLLTDLRSRVDPMDTGVIERAFALAQQAHTGQMRKSGEPYLIHPVRVATTIAALGLDAETIASGLLHDSIEDSELTVFDLTEEVGKDVANLVDGVTKLGKVPYLSRQEQQAESFRKMLLAMSEDIRVLLVKLADRLDNMRTLEHMPREKQLRIGRETMDIYAPLAHRLGVQSIRCELEDLSFRYLEPAVYRSVRERLDALLASNPEFVDNGLQELRDAYLNPGTEEGVEPISWDQEVHGPVVFRASIRTPHQVHRANNGSIGDLEHVDLANYEIITRDRGTCYYSLGILHAHFKPVPGQFRDHIALPRPNRYRALHTTVINSRGVRRRVLIRSEEMDDVAQRGVVAHWKHQDAGSLRAHWSNLAWLRQLMDWQGEVTDPHEFIAAVKADLFADEVYVFTPKGDARVFCKGATPIDFAYSIHTDVGTHCSAARVNGQLVPLRYQLRQGDTIEIIASATSRPRREWLKMCGSSRARARIKQYLRHEQRDQLKGLGRRFVARELAARDVDLADLEADGLVELAAAKFELPRDYKGVDGLYEALGAGLVDLTEVCATLCPR
ncbi:MAG: RelA/SpoT family protein, partial [Nannocystaceae bacterium]